MKSSTGHDEATNPLQVKHLRQKLMSLLRQGHCVAVNPAYVENYIPHVEQASINQTRIHQQDTMKPKIPIRVKHLDQKMMSLL